MSVLRRVRTSGSKSLRHRASAHSATIGFGIASLLTLAPVMLMGQTIDDIGIVGLTWAPKSSAHGQAVTAVGGPYIWKAGEGLVTVGSGFATAVSADGSVVAGSTLQDCQSESSTPAGWTWKQSMGQTPLNLTGHAKMPCVQVHDMSDDGSVVVGTYLSAPEGSDGNTGNKAVRWVNGTPTVLGLLHKGLLGPDYPEDQGHSQATGVSGDGSVVVGFSNAKDDDGHGARGFAAFRWQDGSMTELSKGYACGVSSDGKVAVGSTDPFNEPGPTKALRWVNGVREELGPGAALAANKDGSVIVGRNNTTSSGCLHRGTPSEAFIWTKDDGYRLLKDVLEDDYDMDLEGWELSAATSISDAGEVIVGFDLPAIRNWRVVLCGDVAEWDDTGGGSFGEEDKWSDNVIPDSTRVARFAAGGTYTVSFSEDRQNLRLEVAEDDSVTFELGTTTYTLTGECGDKSIIVDGAKLVLGDGAGVGKRAGKGVSGGTVRAEAAAEVIGSNSPLFAVAPNQRLEIAGGLKVDGESESARIEVIDGGAVTCDTLCEFGSEAGKKGRLVIKGENSSWTLGTLNFGEQGEGSLVTADHAEVKPKRLEMAGGQGGKFTGEVRDGGSLTPEKRFDMAGGQGSEASITVRSLAEAGVTDGDVRVGIKGTATVTVEAGGTLTSGSDEGGSGKLVLGVESESSGEVTVDGAAAAVEDFSEVVVGERGTGKITVRNSGELLAERLRIADEAFTEGTLTVENEGSVEIETTTDLGIQGLGVLSVDKASLKFVGDAVMGVETNGNGSMTLRSTATADVAFLTVGKSGLGSLSLFGGSTMNAVHLHIGGDGSGAGGTGDVTVDGSGSLLFSGGIDVGNGGTGSLTVRNLGAVRTYSLRLFGSSLPSNQGGRIDAGTTVVGLPPAGGKTFADALFADTLLIYGENAVLDTDSLAVHPGGVIGGSGRFPLALTSEGTISPAGTTIPFGTFDLASDLTMSANSVVEIDLGGTAEGLYDRIEADGMVRLDGTLRIRLAEGYVPEVGDSFEIVRGSSLEGEFAAVDAGSIRVSVQYTDQAVIVGVTSSVANETMELPDAVMELAAYPNPVRDYGRVTFDLPEAGPVRVSVYDVLGREVARLVDATLAAGRHDIPVNGGELSGGTYLVRMDGPNGERRTRSLVISH